MEGEYDSPTHCEGKRIYNSEREAHFVRNGIYRRRKQKLRVYFCKKCTGFHLTSKPTFNDIRKVR